jgi:RHS repeat-associated protein
LLGQIAPTLSQKARKDGAPSSRLWEKAWATRLNRPSQTCAATTAPPCSAAQKLATYTYTLGNAGNRTGVTELAGRNVLYGYDNDYRLTSEAITGAPAGQNGTVTYGYDNVGNRVTMTSTLPAIPGGTFSYDANDRIAGDTFDNNGNTISSGGISYVYDFENRLLMRGLVTIVYDGDGNRVSETVGGVTTKYLVDDLNPTGLPQVVEELVNGSLTRTYTYGLNLISENQLIGGTWTPSFYLYDGHGNVRLLANSAGAVTDTYHYDAFGNTIASTGTTPNNFLFSGEQVDNNAGGLYQMRARWYRPAIGRFVTMDRYEGAILNPSTLHKYVFTADNPVNFVDPTGQLVGEYSILTKVTAVTLVGSLTLGPFLAEIFECASEKIDAGPHVIGRNPPDNVIGVYPPAAVPGEIGPREGIKCFEAPHDENPATMPVPPPGRVPGRQPGFFPPPTEPVPTALMDQFLTRNLNYESA